MRADLTALRIGPGTRLGRYELVAAIGRGGMAAVWLARFVTPDGVQRFVAIKTMLPFVAEDDRFIRMFMDEARIASRIEHVNVARTIEVGDHEGLLYLVMEYVDGGSIGHWVREARETGTWPSVGVCLRVAREMAAALHAAHELRDQNGRPYEIVHRDISPQNILMTLGGVTKIIDFGVAKAVDRIGGETKSGSLKGKIRFMAPEQATGAKVDRRADVYGVGGVLYHMLSGALPFSAENEIAYLHRLTSGDPPDPLPESIPSIVKDVVSRALAHDPHARYATCANLKRAIDQVIRELGCEVSADDMARAVAPVFAARDEDRRSSSTLQVMGVPAEGSAPTIPSHFTLPDGKPAGLRRIVAPTPNAPRPPAESRTAETDVALELERDAALERTSIDSGELKTVQIAPETPATRIMPVTHSAPRGGAMAAPDSAAADSTAGVSIGGSAPMRASGAPPVRYETTASGISSPTAVVPRPGWFARARWAIAIAAAASLALAVVVVRVRPWQMRAGAEHNAASPDEANAAAKRSTPEESPSASRVLAHEDESGLATAPLHAGVVELDRPEPAESVDAGAQVDDRKASAPTEPRPPGEPALPEPSTSVSTHARAHAPKPPNTHAPRTHATAPKSTGGASDPINQDDGF